jgi:autotransporter-associated beta strand protein
MRNLTVRIIVLLVNLTVMMGMVNAQRKMENLGRGVVAVRTGTASTFVSWRLLGNEPNTIGFNLYRSTGGGAAVLLNGSVLFGGTNFTDNTADLTKDNAYFVKPVINGTEQAASASFTLTANHAAEPCVRIPIHSGGVIKYVWVGDLDGDGEYDYVIDRQTSPQSVEAYKRDGTFLWSVNLGKHSINQDNISPGSAAIDVGNWDGVTVYDLDGDGKAEVILKTADGVVFGDGSSIVNSDSAVQYVSVLNGLTGAERARCQFPTDYKSIGPLGASFGIGYLNGISPSIIGFMKNRNTNGSFNRLMCAWDFNGTTLSQKWKTTLPFGSSYGTGSDAHQMRILDFDGDGVDEIGEIGFVLKNDGSLLYNLGESGVSHGDRWHVGKLDPNRPGLQGYGIQQENLEGLIEYYYDAGTGKVLWKHSTLNVGDAGRGEAGDIDPRYSGYEVWSFSGVYNAPTNTKITNEPNRPYPNFRLWWNGDLLSDHLNDGKIEKWDYINSALNRLCTPWDYLAIGYDHNPLFYGDILGDWREEVVMTNTTFDQIIIMTTNISSVNRIYTLAQNPEYRNGMTIKGYMQSHMLDYYLGYGMTTPPTPPTQTAKCIWKGNISNNVWDAGTTGNWMVNGVLSTFTQGDDVMFDISGTPDTTVVLNGTLNPASIKVISSLHYSLGGAGSISGTTGILKSGNGALSLNTLCDYTDTTRIEQGSLYVNNTLSQSTMLVGFAATLGGAGTITKAVVLRNGSMISPGPKGSVGTLTFSTGLTLPSGSSCLFDITDDASGTTKPSDKIVMNGNLSITDTMTIVVNKINGTVNAGTYPLIAYSGTFSGNMAKIGVSGLFGQKYALTNTGTGISLTIEAARDADKVIWNGWSDTWDLQTTPAWNLKGSPVTFVANDTVVFDANGANNPVVKVMGTLTVGKILVDVSSNNYTLSGSGNIGGNASLTKTGAGSLSLLTTNSFTGSTKISDGKITVGSLADAGVNSSIGANTSVAPSDFLLENAYLKYTGGTSTSSNKGLTINGTSDTIDVATSGVILSLTGVVTGTGNLVKTGAGTLNFMKSVNTYTGNTIVKGGVLSLGDQTANTSGVGEGSITLDNGTLTLYNNPSSNDYYTNLIVPAGSVGVFNTGQRIRIRGSLTGGGTLNVYIPGNIDRTFFFGDWSAFTGTINVTGVVSSKFRIANSYGYSNVTVNLGVNTAMYHGGTGLQGGDGVPTIVHIGALSGVSGSSIFEENWVVGEKNVDAVFNGLISGNSITKNGTGSWTLTNANTYPGGTIVNGGTLIINNATGSGTGTGIVTVNTGATLAGTGTIAGAVVIANGGTIAPGNNGIGSLIINNNLVLAAGSTTSTEVSKSTASDTIRVTGNITFNGTLAITNANAAAFATGDSYKLFKATTYNGSFGSITPATPGTGQVWDTTALRTTGTIKVKGTQTITFGAITDKTFGDAAFSLSGTASSGLTLTYTSSDPLVASVSGNTVTIIGAGSVSITATQPGDGSYLAANSISQSFLVNKASQTISFSDLPSKKVGDAPFSFTATSSSGLPVSYTSSNTSVATVSGSTLTIVGTGTTSITASQAGNNNYQAASDVVKPLNVTSTRVVSLTDKDVSIAPNPVSDVLTVQMGIVDDKTTIEIYTLSGVQVYSEKVMNKTTAIPMSQYQPGLYIIKVTSQNGVIIKQIIKQ